MGLDVIVHGEFERTDMVEYFAEQMDGYYTTRGGWVLSYGSRCVRAPILAAPPTVREPMTVDEWRIAQAATDKPVKGMLTGPVTIVNWSFRPPGVPDDRLFWAVAQPIADEVRNLVDAGARVIQVDEPAVRERGRCRPRTRHACARSTAGASGPRSTTCSTSHRTSRCTRTCATATSATSCPVVGRRRGRRLHRVQPIEGRLVHPPVLRAVRRRPYPDRPGVDVHSPHTPGASVMSERLHHFRGFMDAADLWVNPDCGLKTRRWEEIERQATWCPPRARCAVRRRSADAR